MKSALKFLMLTASAALALFPTRAASKAEEEAEYYPITRLPIPANIVLEAGALQILPDRKLAVSTRLGEIWFVSGAFDNNPAAVKFTRFASGLHEILGLTTRGDGWIYATQRGEVTRIRDTNGDGRADLFETVADGWGINGDYHEYAFGSKFDRDGNIWVTLCLTGSFTSENPYRGWALRVGSDGKVTPTTSGLRSPGGVGTNHLGDMFYADNQGPWNGTCWLKHLKPGAFVGNPSGNRWYELASTVMGPRPKDPESNSRIPLQRARISELVPPAIGFPYNRMGQSASGIQNDGTAGKFGPFQNQLFVGDQTWSTIMRVYLEQVNGVYQGACFPFREGFGSGTLSLEMADDGTLFVGGTDRGWGARGGKPFALERLAWSGKIPFEIQEMRAKSDGFELTFTQPVDPISAADPTSYQFRTFTYIYQSNYGSPEVDESKSNIQLAIVSADRRSVHLKTALNIGHLHELKPIGIRSANGKSLLHPLAYYTLNEIPK
ncbi:MAG: hypothetical protein EXS25_00220 [Pedosphaera sp.]|nr:hypothetical protein [Pedosphaera sp.]